MSKLVQIQIAAAVYRPGSNQNKIVLLSSGPHVNVDLHEQNIGAVHANSHSLLDVFLEMLPKAINDALPSLPERVAEQPRYLDVARVMLNKIEAGKQNARCLAYEKDGQTHLLIITDKEPT